MKGPCIPLESHLYSQPLAFVKMHPEFIEWNDAFSRGFIEGFSVLPNGRIFIPYPDPKTGTDGAALPARRQRQAAHT